jgi:hypothetical protein
MASPTKKFKIRKKIKKAASATRRKNKTANVGSTAADLPLTKPNANELAQKKS